MLTSKYKILGCKKCEGNFSIWEVKCVNKRIFITFTILLAVILIVSSMLAIVDAEQPTVEVFTVEPYTDSSTITNLVPLVPPQEKIVSHETIRISSGALREYDYSGELGTGKLYLETILTVASVSGSIEFPPGSGMYTSASGTGGGHYKYTLIIDGPYGSGTLEGIGELDWTFDLTVWPIIYEQTEQVKLRPTAGDLDLKRVCVEGYADYSVLGWWWTTTTVTS